MDLTTRNSSFLLEKSMNFLWAKQAAILDNVANAETPGYRAKVVTFEETLRSQLERAQMTDTPIKETRSALEGAHYQVSRHPGINRMDDNGVNVTEQSVEMIRNAYQLQYVMNSINSELSILRMAARGQ